MSVRLRYTGRARMDLREIRAFILESSGARAARLQLEKIQNRIVRLREFPLTGPERLDLGTGRRAVVVSPYVVVYRAEQGEIIILRVLHGARDLPDVMDE